VGEEEEEEEEEDSGNARKRAKYNNGRRSAPKVRPPFASHRRDSAVTHIAVAGLEQQVSILELFNGSVDELDEMLGSNTPVKHQREQSTTPTGLADAGLQHAFSGGEPVVPKVKVEPTNDSAAASASNPFVQAAEFFKATVPSDARGTALQSPDQLISPFKCALHCTVARRCRCPH